MTSSLTGLIGGEPGQGHCRGIACKLTPGEVAAHSPAIDIWSIGCIFAEILLGKPLFPGRNVVHQLELITDLLGTPSSEVIAKVSTPPQCLNCWGSRAFSDVVLWSCSDIEHWHGMSELGSGCYRALRGLRAFCYVLQANMHSSGVCVMLNRQFAAVSPLE